MSVTATVVVAASSEEAWARWSDIPGWPDWNTMCLAASLNGPLAPGTQIELNLRYPRGRNFWTRPRLTVVEPPAHIAWEARGPGLVASTRTTLTPEGDGTLVSLTSESLGRLAFAFKAILGDRAQAKIHVAMLNALAESFRGAPA